jgi:AraC family transcriptional regulator
LAKVAVNFERGPVHAVPSEASQQPQRRCLARGDGWAVSHVVCILGPRDRPFEEIHSNISIAIVAAGTFQYRSASGRELMTPGSLLLGNAGQAFECGHEHGIGDRCIAFSYTPDFFDSLLADAGIRGASPDFKTPRLPPLRGFSPIIARAYAGLACEGDVSWEELGIELAVRAAQVARGHSPAAVIPQPGAVARVTRIVRTMVQATDSPHSVRDLAREAGLSPYYFLRTFHSVTGVTPHQYLSRVRLRQAATRLRIERKKIVDIALDCGFEDVSNFNRAFRAEFGVSPRTYRSQKTNGSR